MAYNTELKRLYESKHEGLIEMFAKLNAEEANFAFPLMLHVWDQYDNAPVKLMIVGQETNGWGSDICIESEDAIYRIQQIYENFNLGQKYTRTNFWPWLYEINRLFGNPNNNSFVWNNLLKFGKEDYKGRPTRNVTQAEAKFFNVLVDEIAILKPEVCIFLTGPNYDEDIKAKFEDAEFIKFGDYPMRQVAKIKSRSLPINTYRTYHPGFGNRNSEWYHIVFEAIVKDVK